MSITTLYEAALQKHCKLFISFANERFNNPKTFNKKGGIGFSILKIATIGIESYTTNILSGSTNKLEYYCNDQL